MKIARSSNESATAAGAMLSDWKPLNRGEPAGWSPRFFLSSSSPMQARH